MIFANETVSREAFELLARRIAMGEQVAETEINATLADALEAPEALDQLADSFRHRHSVRAALATAKSVHDRYTKVRAKIEAANQKLEEAVESHRVETEALQHENSDLRKAMGQAHATEADLFATAPQRLRDASREAHREHDLAVRRLEQLKDEAVRFRASAHPSAPAKAEAYEREAAALEQNLAALQEASTRAYRACVEW